MTKEKETIKFGDLSWVCKTGIIGGFITVITYVVSFIRGFLTAF